MRNEEHVRALEKALHKQLGTTDEILKLWEEKDYPADSGVSSKLWKYIEGAKYIRIIGDYDADGICASHILSKSIKSVFPDKKVSVRIPRRFSEGYGMNMAIADEIIEEMDKDNSLIITVDNGIKAKEPLEKLKKLGYKVIITDHHSLDEKDEIPNVDMCIDPAVDALPNPLEGNYWCGAAVAYKLCEQFLDEPLSHDLKIYAAIATKADCMPLREGNWGLLRYAIKEIRKGNCPEALSKLLLSMNQATEVLDEETIGFYLGPAFNAPGRLMDRGAVEVLKYLNRPTDEERDNLIALNDKRKELKKEEYERIVKHLKDTGGINMCPIWVSLPGLHEGIVGILAGELVKEFHKPAIVLTNAENNPDEIKGSARSYGDFDMFEYLSKMSTYLTGFGGHKGAAGLRLKSENFDKVRSFQIDESLLTNTEEILHIMINKEEIPSMCKIVNKFRPFGEGNLAPVFETDIDLNKDGARFSKDGKHVFIDNPKENYKITYFNYCDKEKAEKFGAFGHISENYFANRITPMLNIDESFDLMDERER